MSVVTLPGPFGPLGGEFAGKRGARDIVVIVPGSGPTDRNGNGPAGLNSDTYRLLAHGFAARGVSSLRIDKRGLFSSQSAIPDANAVTISDYADDLCDWVGLATTMAQRVWIAGHSEGGLVALAAAPKLGSALTGVMLLATPGRPLDEVLLAQIGAAGGPDRRAEAAAILAEIRGGSTRATDQISPPLRPVLRAEVQGYWRDLLSQTPAQRAGRWDGPTLVLQGGADLQCILQDAQILLQALAQGQLSQLETATHMLKSDVPGDPLATYRDPARPLHPGVVPALCSFMGRAALG